jgi:hypothetical protein
VTKRQRVLAQLAGFAQRQEAREDGRKPLHKYLRGYAAKHRAEERAKRDAQRAAAAALQSKPTGTVVPQFPARKIPTIEVRP